ncbi:VWA domain-containing protein [Microbacterium album]|uniref:VWFA domain-containing protein n=1 Tax=Microbacterium album TaxID=2053191 RepID=A0A917MNQ4_9MICO|nr:VWA domain-containing protein [Microbacterium album]GGH50336.1 hypothetical protein GCM10010921_29030 [Microbacterium album]
MILQPVILHPVILQPVLPPLPLAVIVLPALGVAAWALVRSRTASSRLAWALRVLLVVAVAVLALRPGMPGGTAQTVATDTDVVLVVDATSSITAEDWGDGSPRLDGVRSDVQALVAAYPGARFALLTFDTNAELRLPLTTDVDALITAMEVLRPPVTQNARGSSIGVASAMLADTLRAAATSSPERARMVFYLGDGEQTAPGAPESFADSAALVDGGAVLGYGTQEGGRMRAVTGRGDDDAAPYILDGAEPALSRIDEAALQTIADEIGVPYQHRTAETAPELPPAPAATSVVAEARTPGSTIELSWLVALLVAGLLAVEVARGAAHLARTLRLARPGRPDRAGGRPEDGRRA